ncbi:hypothetical protein O6H91_07G015500 [Diphasiastrum complanatum]|nr:hypothetical protein O6H91_07G015500 [Diphasiastrum complanatum]
MIYLCRRKMEFRKDLRATKGSLKNNDHLSQIFSDKKGSQSPTTLFSFKELKLATASFAESRLLGDGGFGTVYEGRLTDGRVVAVKKLNKCNKQGLQQFYNEVMILSQVKHNNLVQLLGCCLEGTELMLVYEFVANGTLADHIHGFKGKHLCWETRLTIAVETAQALAYLHCFVEPPILHRDVKSTNILLDENFKVKVADFGLSRLMPPDTNHISTAPQGTPGYLDPDYYESYQLTDKSDVYSYGVVLMELISAKRAVDMSRERKEINLASMAISRIQCGALEDLADPELEIESRPEVREEVSRVAELAFRCLASQKDDRPSMREVAQELQSIRSSRSIMQTCMYDSKQSKEANIIQTCTEKLTDSGSNIQSASSSACSHTGEEEA